MAQATDYIIVLYCVKGGKTTRKTFRSYHAARAFEKRVLEEGGACFWQTSVG